MMGKPKKAKASRLEAWRQRRRVKRTAGRDPAPHRDRPEHAAEYDDEALKRLGERTGILG